MACLFQSGVSETGVLFYADCILPKRENMHNLALDTGFITHF
jgi:hypothetical protein